MARELRVLLSLQCTTTKWLDLRRRNAVTMLQKVNKLARLGHLGDRSRLQTWDVHGMFQLTASVVQSSNSRLEGRGCFARTWFSKCLVLYRHCVGARLMRRNSPVYWPFKNVASSISFTVCDCWLRGGEVPRRGEVSTEQARL